MTKRPNLLFIMDDQHRWDFLGAAGASFVNTPNLDRLAARGVLFSQCTTNCPVCAPARIGLAAGLQPGRMGSLNNASYLPRSVPTYMQRLRDHGYRVGCVGKLDLAKPDKYNGRYGDRPCVYGWGFTHPEECEGKMHAGHYDEPQGPYGFWLKERGLYDRFRADYKARSAKGWIKESSHDSVLPCDAFEDVYIGRRATEWIETIPDDFPWHYFVSFVGPHDPFDPPTEYADRYRNADMPPAIQDDMSGKPEWIKPRNRGLEPEEVAVTRRQYCAAIEAIDDQVGAILDALERRGFMDNTYIVFSSDHGEMLGDHGIYTKSVPYEGALHVPLIAAGPGIEGGWTSEALVELIDINPTLCEWAGIPAQPNIDARSFAPVTSGATDTHRTETVAKMKTFRLIRTERYKLVMHTNDRLELYDLAEDPQECHNVADEHPDIASQLNARMQSRFTEGKWLR